VSAKREKKMQTTMPLAFTGANVLRLIRNNEANNVGDLVKYFSYRGTTLVASELSFKLSNLQDAGLIETVGDGHYQVLPQWAKIQGALGLSLKKLASLDSPSAVVVEPLFGKPNELRNAIDVFVLMPFTEKLKPVWEEHTKKVVISLGLSAKRADDFFTAHAVMADVWNAISGARVIIADCTGRNPNVFYEIGVAHTTGKPVILTTQDPNDVPFDLRQLRYIEYEYTPPGMSDYESSLEETLKSIIEKMD
jgi:hypothetical protein